MCRHVAWLGEPRTVADLVLAPPHSLLVQSYAPRHQRHGVVNADGWGIGYYTAGRLEPARWRSARPIWGDASLASVAPTLASGCILAAVRSATTGMPLDETAAAPFARDGWLLSHNGRVDRSVLPASRSAESAVDSALLAALVFDRGPQELAATVAEVGAADPGARLNVLMTDGRQILATTWGDTLFVSVSTAGVVVASEPYDDDENWDAIPDHSLVCVDDENVTVTRIFERQDD